MSENAKERERDDDIEPSTKKQKLTSTSTSDLHPGSGDLGENFVEVEGDEKEMPWERRKEQERYEAMMEAESGEEEIKMIQTPIAWTIRKTLTKSDLTTLRLSVNLVAEHILSHLSDVPTNRSEIIINVHDRDSDSTHKLSLGYGIDGYDRFGGFWNGNFVQRRGLKEGNEIGLAWNPSTSTFGFGVISASGVVEWSIKKTLKKYDLDKSCKLHLRKQDISDHILRHLRDQPRHHDEAPIKVRDFDTKAVYDLVVGYGRDGYDHIRGTWQRDFVLRLSLKVGDQIGLLWDNAAYELIFGVIARND